MGNNQSNEENWKLFRIKETNHVGSFFRIYLNDYVTYKDGKYWYINIGYANNPWHTIISGGNYSSFGTWKEGQGVYINLNRAREENHTYNFETGAARAVYAQVVERTDSNGNIITEVAEFVAGVGEMFNDRNQLVASIEQSRHANNHSWTKQSSWDMPPGWK